MTLQKSLHVGSKTNPFCFEGNEVSSTDESTFFFSNGKITGTQTFFFLNDDFHFYFSNLALLLFW